MNKIIFLLFILIAPTTLQAHCERDKPQTDARESYVGVQLLSSPKITYPPIAAEGGVVAKLHLRVCLGKDGVPYKTEIVKRDPEDVYLFDEASRKLAMQSKFSPALDQNGSPKSSAVILPIHYQISGFEPPQIIEQAEPEFPNEALAMGLEGGAVVAVLVDENGKARDDKIFIAARRPLGTTVFDAEAIKVAKKSKFKEAKLHGRGSYGWVFLKIKFHLPPNSDEFLTSSSN